jgi:hypothetical protein
MMMKPARIILLSTATLVLLLSGADARAAVRGKALLLDAPHRYKPGNLILCVINGEKRKFETLAEGKVIDARFSPDGKKVVYGLDGKVKIMDLEKRKSRDVGSFAAKFTYFTWGLGEKIYFTDGEDMRQIFCLDIKSGKRTLVHKGNKGRSTVSLDGKRAAWVMPPVAAFVGGKTYRYVGGCGGAVSPSGKYLTSNVTTGHRLMGIVAFDENGPSGKPIASVTAPPINNYTFNGFSFGRTDEWVCYTAEVPRKVLPAAYVCYWQTGDHVLIAKKYVIKDFFDETDVLPAGATLEKITVCAEGPTNAPLTKETVNVGLAKRLKVVGHYATKSGPCTPRLREGVTWKVDAAKLSMTGSSYKGKAASGRITVTAEYKGKRDSFDVTVLPKLTGTGFKAEYFSDATFTKSALVRVDPCIDFRWHGISSPGKAINGRKPWSVRWTGKIDIQTAGEYTFYFRQGEGNDHLAKGAGDGEKKRGYGVWVDGKLVITMTKRGHHGWNAPWTKPKASAPITLKKGMHSVRVTSVDNKTAHPVVAQLYWSGPGIKQSLLGGGYVHSKGGMVKSR